MNQTMMTCVNKFALATSYNLPLFSRYNSPASCMQTRNFASNLWSDPRKLGIALLGDDRAFKALGYKTCLSKPSIRWEGKTYNFCRNIHNFSTNSIRDVTNNLPTLDNTNDVYNVNNKIFPKRSDFSYKFLTRLLDTLSERNNELTNSEESQKLIESIGYEEFEFIFEAKKDKKLMIAGVNNDLISSDVSKYLTSKIELINIYISNLCDNQVEILDKNKLLIDNKKNYENILIATVISSLKKEYLLSLCLYMFLLVYTHQDTEDD